MKETVSGVSPRLVPHQFQTLTFSIILRSQSAPTIPLALLPSAAKSAAFYVAIFMKISVVAPTLVVFTLFPVLQLHPLRSGSTLHSSPSMQGCIWHHHFCATMEAVAAEGQKGKGARRQSATTTNSLASRTDAASNRMKFSDWPWQPRASRCRGGDKKREQSRGCRLKVLSSSQGAPSGETWHFRAKSRFDEKWAKPGEVERRRGSIQLETPERRITLARLARARAQEALRLDLTRASFFKDVELWEFRRNLVRLKLFCLTSQASLGSGGTCGSFLVGGRLSGCWRGWASLLGVEALALRLKLISFTAAPTRTPVTVSLHNTVIKLSLFWFKTYH